MDFYVQSKLPINGDNRLCRSACLAGSCLKKDLSILVLKLGMQFDQNFQKDNFVEIILVLYCYSKAAFILWLDERDSLSTCERGC